MNTLMLMLSVIFGVLPLNSTLKNSMVIIDFAAMLIIPVAYLLCYCLILFNDEFGIYKLKECNGICQMGSILFMHLGCFLYLSIYLLTLRRGKGFFINFRKSLHEIDGTIEKCRKLTNEKIKPPKAPYAFYIIWGFVCLIFGYAFYYDGYKMYSYMGNKFVVSIMVTAFPFFAGSVVQGQLIYYVSVIMDRFNSLNSLFETISQECERKNGPLTIFDIESNAKKGTKFNGTAIMNKPEKDKDDSSSSEDDDDKNDKGKENDENHAETHPTHGLTSESNLPDLFKLHDKILAMSVMTNAEFGVQCVPYMTVCFIIAIFGIFLETKVIFIVGGKSPLMDYVAQIYVTWSLIMMVVAYLVLRLCCNANNKSKTSAMIVHEIMQKKPAFMLGNDFYYNKMKSFTLQFLHWEGFFQFNGIGLFALDYTFIFSTVSAATSYLIVLLQFDMTAILKVEGLL